MRSLRLSLVRDALLVTLALLCAAPARGQVGGTPAPPVTFWQFLGIPQGIKKLQGATRNRNGNHPNREPKPPMRAIADPRNLESKDPSIKKAAEVKQAEDLKKQKIKAVKYLASIGCGCYNLDGGVTAALVASMSDCTEDVRYETIKAISDAAQNGCCSKCGSSCCCNKDILTALAKVAYERDDHGCYIEPSERVRQAAAEALRHCCPNDSPPVIIAEEQTTREPERESAEEIQQGETRETSPLEPGPPPPPAAPGAAGSESLPTGAGASYYTPPMPTEAAAAPESAVDQASSAAPFGFGVIVDVSPEHGLAHVHFDQSDVQAVVGSEVGVYQQVGNERLLVARLQVVNTFAGSANVTGTPEALGKIARGDVVLRPTVISADVQPTAEAAPIVEQVQASEPATEPLAAVSAPVVEVAAPPVVQAVEPAARVVTHPTPPRQSPRQVQRRTSTHAQPHVQAEPQVVQTSDVRPLTPTQRISKPATARRPVSAHFMR